MGALGIVHDCKEPHYRRPGMLRLQVQDNVISHDALIFVSLNWPSALP